MSTASKVARHKELHPELYCPHRRCLWRTGGGPCPRHLERTTSANTQEGHTPEDDVADMYRVNGFFYEDEEEEEEEEDPKDEERGSRCGPDCGYCGACS